MRLRRRKVTLSVSCEGCWIFSFAETSVRDLSEAQDLVKGRWGCLPFFYVSRSAIAQAPPSEIAEKRIRLNRHPFLEL